MNDSVWQELRGVFQRSTGMILPDAVRGHAFTLLERLATRAGWPQESYLSHLDEDRETRQVLLDELGLGTTWFMRDAAGVTALVEALARLAPASGMVQLWSVGCSTGEEPYTLAMAVVEADIRAHILATDLNRAALETARNGMYSGEAVRRLPAAWQRRHVERVAGGQVRVADRIRRMVSFQLHNLLDSDLPPSGRSDFDAIVCRNVLIYFDRDHALDVIDRLVACCQPRGYLLLGAIERPLFWMSNGTGPHGDTELVPISSTGTRRRTTSPGLAVAAPAEPTAHVAASNGSREIHDRPEPAPRSRRRRRITRQKDDPAVYRLLGHAEVAERDKQLDVALAFVDQAIERDPLHASAHLQRGRILQQRGDTAQAIESLRTARCLDRDAWLPPYLLARCLETISERDEALEAYRYALGALQAGGRSGYFRQDIDIEDMASLTADACKERIDKLSGA